MTGRHSPAERAHVVLLVTEDWFVLSHFQPLVAVAKEFARTVTVVTRCSGRAKEIESLGARVVDFDYGRSSTRPLRELGRVWRLLRILRSEKPDLVHLVAMKPVVLGGAAIMFHGTRAVVHMTGLGILGFATTTLLRSYRFMSLRLIAWLVRKPSSYLVVENSDDLAFLRDGGVDPAARFAIVGGAGVDPSAYPALAPPDNATAIAAFVGRMIRPKGVDVLMRAFELLRKDGVPLELELYGASDTGNLDAIAPELLEAWCKENRARWLGQTADVRNVWQRADIFVLPARSREGMPRAMLEAAACARPLIVTDVPGCRQFVRDGIEGFVVPPGDAPALAEALARLASDRGLRHRMGSAARMRLLEGFTEGQVKECLRSVYRSVFGS